MKAVVQRVSRARVTVDGVCRGEIGRGLLVLLGVGQEDELAVARRLAAKVCSLRIFEDAVGRMNRGIEEVDGAVLCISQFTLYADVRRGRRPSFTAAAAPELALALYASFCEAVEEQGVRCERGVFGAHMAVELINDGPVTLIVDSAELEQPRRA